MHLQKALITTEQICATPAVAGENGAALTDAHKYTRTLIRSHYPILVGIDVDFVDSITPAIAFPNLIADMRQVAERLYTAIPTDPEATKVFKAAKSANLNKILTSTSDFVQRTGGVEAAESYISIPDLMLRTWNLAGRLSAQKHDASYLAQILDCLEGNVSDGGGCMPGVVARLYPAYARLMFNQLENLTAGAYLGPNNPQLTEEVRQELGIVLAPAPAVTAANQQTDPDLRSKLMKYKHS